MVRAQRLVPERRDPSAPEPTTAPDLCTACRASHPGLVEALARVVALLEVDGREVPGSIMAALRKASEAGRPIGVS